MIELDLVVAAIRILTARAMVMHNAPVVIMVVRITICQPTLLRLSSILRHAEAQSRRDRRRVGRVHDGGLLLG